MKLAVQTLLLPGADIHERFHAAAAAGFDGVEVATGSSFDLLTREIEDEVAAASAASGIPVAAICTAGSHDPVIEDRAERSRRIAVLQELLAIADRLGATGVVSVPVRPFAGVDHSLLPGLAIETYAEIVAGLGEGRSRIFLEPLNRFEAKYLLRVEQAVELARAVNHPRCVALADTFHMNIEETSWTEPVLGAGALLGHVHIADNNRFEPGAGMIDFRPFFGALQQIGYADYISMECFHPSGSGLSGPPMETLQRTAVFMRAEWDTAGA